MTPTQPQPGGSDGYGVLIGATARRDPYVYQSGNDPVTGAVVYSTITVVHQINTSQANPSLYLPSMSVTPSNNWRFYYRSEVDMVAAAGDPKQQITAEWYNSSGTMISENKSGFKTRNEASVLESSRYWWQPSIDVTVPANAATVHIVAELQCVNPVNAWSIFGASYTQLP